jgi:hypothetical protein
LAAYWRVLEWALGTRHGAAPIHTVEEMALLMDRFPGDIELVTGTLGGEVVAGTVLFHAATATHTQYLAAGPAGRETSALDAGMVDCIAAATRAGNRWFSFGTSNEDGGRVLNEGLYRWKTEFGAGGVVHEFYRLVL